MMEARRRRLRRLIPPAVVLALGLGWAIAARLVHPAGSDLVVITIDTLRADHLSCYGNRARTPAIDRLASGGTLFEASWTNLPRTTPAMASMLTGRHAQNHGVRFLRQPLPDGEMTLAQHLSANGFRTGALIAGGPLEPVTGLDRGFSTYRSYVDLKAMLLTVRAIPWMIRNLPRRTFLWVHYFDPHFGYQPPWPYSTAAGIDRPPGFSVFEDIRSGKLRFGQLYFDPPLTAEEHEWLRGQYRGEVEYTDAAIGVLLRAIRMRDFVTGRRTLIALTADHGESLGEHGCWYEHGEFLYEQDLRIPLILSWPGRIGGGVRTGERAEMIDIAPTILDLLDLPDGRRRDGRSLVPVLDGGRLPARPVFTESGESLFEDNPRRPVPGVAGKWRSVLDGDWKLILIPGPEGESLELYRLSEDPSERENRASSSPERASALRSLLDSWMASAERASDPNEPVRDEETLERLRSLGYVD